VLAADPEEVIDAIRSGGLAETKTARIQTVLTLLMEERGELSLEHLHGLSDADAKKELMRFKGVGPKTVACVLMFTLNRAEFPVDAHVVRVSSHARPRAI
jgi:endonuclease-3